MPRDTSVGPTLSRVVFQRNREGTCIAGHCSLLGETRSWVEGETARQVTLSAPSSHPQTLLSPLPKAL